MMQPIQREIIKIEPQRGPQTEFLSTSADIAFYGGAAGGGKTFALILEGCRNTLNPKFGAVCFRRTMPEIKNEGGLWDESENVYYPLGAVPNKTESYWRFKSGATVSFSHLEHEKTVYNWQGSQIALLMFDEITHFTRKQFFYMLSRNRSTCGIKPYVRASTNPDKKSWVREFIDWWLYPKDSPLAGYPDPSKSGVIRWFIVEDKKIIWSENKEYFGEKSKNAKSFTFIPAKLEDNKILLAKDPGYRANLESLDRVERLKLLGGNWDAEEKTGEIFQRQWFPIVDVAPKLKRVVRYWDRAGSDSQKADFTVGLKLGVTEANQLIVLNVNRFQGRPLVVETAVKNTASQDGVQTEIGLEQDPGQAGVAEVGYHVRNLLGYQVKVFKKRIDKVTAAKPASSQAEQGNILLLRGYWNDDFLDELEGFPEGGNDDQVDALSGAVNMISEDVSGTMTEDMANTSGFESNELEW